MAAWYVFSALGFYPMNPDSGIYAIGSPVVSKAVIHLDGEKYHGRTFTVIADNNSGVLREKQGFLKRGAGIEIGAIPK